MAAEKKLIRHKTRRVSTVKTSPVVRVATKVPGGKCVLVELSDGNQAKLFTKSNVRLRTKRLVHGETNLKTKVVGAKVLKTKLSGIASQASKVALPYKPDSFSVRDLQKAIRATQKV